MRQHYKPDFSRNRKLIVGEGESDLRFFQAFCIKNAIEGFEYAFTGMHEIKANGEYAEAGFAEFGKFLTAFGRTADLAKVTDIVLVCDTGDIVPANPNRRFTLMQGMISGARYGEPPVAYRAPAAANTPDAGAVPRVHVLIVPWLDRDGGIETLCLNAAASAAGAEGNRILECVEAFANCVDISNLTHEKQDKLRLQTFLSGSWKTRPEIRAEQIWSTHKSALIPLDSDVFAGIRDFLAAVAAL